MFILALSGRDGVSTTVQNLSMMQTFRALRIARLPRLFHIFRLVTLRGVDLSFMMISPAAGTAVRDLHPGP